MICTFFRLPLIPYRIEAQNQKKKRKIEKSSAQNVAFKWMPKDSFSFSQDKTAVDFTLFYHKMNVESIKKIKKNSERNEHLFEMKK